MPKWTFEEVEYGGVTKFRWSQEGLTVLLWPSDKPAAEGRNLRYQFFDSTFDANGEIPIFDGDDYCIPSSHEAFSLGAIEGILGFLSLRDGDTDDEYFDEYSERQLQWRDTRAEEAELYQLELEEWLVKEREG